MSSKSDEMVFEETKLLEVPVKIDGVRFILLEASSDEVINHRNAILAYTKIGDNGNVSSYSGTASVEPLLVSRCLYTTLPVDKDKPEGPVVKNKPVGLPFVNTMKNNIMKALFNRIKDISGMNDVTESLEALEKQRDELNTKIDKIYAEREAAKNSLGDTPMK